MAFTSMMLAVVAVVLLICSMVGIASYVMTSLSVYTIAKRREINNPWLAWIPVANYWIIGSIADDYDEKNGIKRKWRITLLALYIIFMAIFLVGYIGMIVAMVLYMVRTEYGTFDAPMNATMLSIFVGIYVFAIVLSLISIAVSICYYICVFKIFESTVPERAVSYLLVSLLVPFGYPICLMLCRKKGYPREEVEVCPPVPETILPGEDSIMNEEEQ